MFYHLKNVLEPAEVKRIIDLTEKARFVDGKRTNVGHRGKHNLQIPTDDRLNDEPAALIRNRLAADARVHAIVQARTMSRATFARYEPGMEYGEHVDEGLFASRPAMRPDVSCTVFLSAPDSYSGGELVIKFAGHQHRIKGNAGDVVLYPSTTLHRVARVTEGVRLVAVAWFQSVIRDQHRREVFSQLQAVVNDLTESGKDRELAVRLGWVQANLLRMWAEV